jgi:hypothetical protein
MMLDECWKDGAKNYIKQDPSFKDVPGFEERRFAPPKRGSSFKYSDPQVRSDECAMRKPLIGLQTMTLPCSTKKASLTFLEWILKKVSS